MAPNPIAPNPPCATKIVDVQWIGRQLYRSGYVRSAIASRASLSELRRQHDRRLLLALVLVVLGLLLGFPVVSLLGLLAATLQEPVLVTTVAPILYALSWILFGIGSLLGGGEALRQVRAFNRWLTRVVVGWLLGEGDRTGECPSLPPS